MAEKEQGFIPGDFFEKMDKLPVSEWKSFTIRVFAKMEDDRTFGKAEVLDMVNTIWNMAAFAARAEMMNEFSQGVSRIFKKDQEKRKNSNFGSKH